MKKRNWFIGVLSVVVLALAACSTPSSNTTQETSSKAQSNSVFTYAISGEPSSTNPITTSDRWGLTITNMIFSPLIRIEGDGSQKFELAKSIETSQDGLVLTVHLRQDVKWSDGQAFTADDVVFTYEQKAKKENGNAKSMWIGDEAIQVVKVDDYTVEFRLPTVSAAALENVATEIYIMPKHIYKDVKDFSVSDLGITPVGTGPYKLKEHVRGEYFQFEANEHYYGGKAAINTVVLRIINSTDTAKLALQKGEIDAAVVLPSDISELGSQVTPYAYSENRIGYMGLNTKTTELSDKRVRQAILYALNKDDMNKAAYLSTEYYTNPYSILPPNNPFVTNDVEKYETNVEKSKALLAEAGVTNLTLRLGYSASDAAQTLQATLIQQQLQQVGITVELAGGDGTALFTELRKKGSTQYHLFLGGYIMGNDPDLYSVLFAPGQRSNYFQFDSQEVAKLFQDGATELDPAKRKEIYNTLQQTIVDNAIIYPIVDNRRVLVVNNRIGNVEKAGLIPIYTLEDMSKLIIK
ncbi:MULTISPECIES: ABC transporter substrate-binding protein [unclassified Granulicatella]|uniref:ABC transporter substrate-binding protein n=1 Tax=unclassified Granulicatella TaxID=2630493 RepID=UPI001074621E|nr:MULTISPECIES: ABC transporter substrate-binding protein [unclassified Granulicatella]MBF0779935.1 ABC transporter substrate-binding protein [Granulicatella sp. 19428wC4_WM01]TFU96046.1 ABC transporter substrate-binding protein [Granulicatella sp. WM01]